MQTRIPHSDLGAAVSSVEQFKQQASIATGLTDFGSERFEESLGRLLNALSSEAQLTPAGWESLRQRLLKSLTDRLHIQAALTAHPEILEQPFDPIIITGLNRTGTTKLHRLMATEPGFRTLPLWEAMNPVPLPGEAGGQHHERVARADAAVRALRAASPQAHAGHPILPLAAEEETYLTQMDTQWTSWFGFARVPTYMAWANEASMLDSYRWLRKTLLYLQWRNGGRHLRWLLKAPFHMGFIDDLVTAFPSVRFIQCHRAPLLDPVASLSKLVYLGRKLASDVDEPQAVGRDVCGHLAAMMKRNVEQRRRHAARFLDVDYRDTLSRGVTLLQRIYAWLGLALSEQQTYRAASWDTTNPQHTHGKFQYSPAEVGLSADYVERQFGDYAAWLQVFASHWRPANDTLDSTIVGSDA